MTTSKKAGKKKAPPARARKEKAEDGDGGIENRTGRRIPIQLLVDYKANGHYLFDFCRDLGTGGVFIETKTPLDQGSPIELTFTIPDSKETLNAKGTVIWVQRPVDNATAGMGVQFSGFTGEQRKILEHFVQRYHGNRFTKEAKTDKKAAS
jgi:type IV pilus assembly protein PilZ